MIWCRGLFGRRWGRTIGMAAGVAIAVALLASIGAFLAGSKATMTRRATANVAVDWQVETQPGGKPAAVASAVRRVATKVESVGFATTTGLQATSGGTSQTTGPGIVLGIPASYRRTFPAVLRPLVGTTRGVLVAQQTAANLHVAPGDSVRIGRAGLPPVDVRVGGVVDLPTADSLFQAVGAPPGAQPQAPPDNVVLVPTRRWHQIFDPLAATRPELLRTQVHARLRHTLPSDPAAAYSRVTGAARNLEAKLAGAGLVGDNLGATLAAARSDALYAQILFLFLGLPGAILAGLLTAAVSASGTDRRRRDQAVLRARGATTGVLVRLALTEAVIIGSIGAAFGVVAATVVGRVAFGTASFGATTAAAVAWIAAAVAVGLGIATLAVVVPAWRDARRLTVVGARREIGRLPTPRWLLVGVDVVVLTASAAVFWLTSRNGYELVLAPEGTPSISVSYWALAGPALLWAGAGLFAWRVTYFALASGRRFGARVARPFSGRLAPTVGATMQRQRRLLSSSLALVALTTAFAGSTAVFNRTYRAQAEVDARLTNGADVTVTEPSSAAGATRTLRQLRAVAGVGSVEPMQHRFAYVGADLQDLYGVDPATIVDATKLQNAYFQGGSARSLMNRLRHQPDGLLVSAETVKDFQLRPGDTVRLRLRDARTRQLTTVPFRYIGVGKEFPTAPRDSFLVANAHYVARATHDPAIGTYLVATDGTSPGTVAQRIRSVVGTDARVTDINTARRVVGSSLTAVDLAGLTRVELGFALVLAAAATGLMLALGFAERRRSFAIATALGAKRRQLGGFVWTEAIVVTIGGLVLGGISGWLLAEMLVKVLTGVFDPPPDALTVPWGYLIAVAAAAIVSVVFAGRATIRRALAAPVSTLREF